MTNQTSHSLSIEADDNSSLLADAIVNQRLFELLPMGLIVFDEKLQILRANQPGAFLIERHRDLGRALGEGIFESRFEDWPTRLRAVVDEGVEQRFDKVLYGSESNGERLLDLTCVPLMDEVGRSIGGALIVNDVTESVGLEQRLAVSERMAAVGKLAAKVAHELNNPLDGILRYLNLSLRAVEMHKPDKLPDYLTEARSGLLRMSHIVRELVEFSRSTHTAFEDAGINTMIEESVKVMSEHAARNQVSVVYTLHENMPSIRGTNLFQVFCNLIKNAIDAMPNGGTLTISTSVDHRDAIIRFADTGEGLPEEIEQIFEPFFTTKPPGKGTGLGLAICKEVIEKYKGRITPEQRREGGTVFTVAIPISQCTGDKTNESDLHEQE